MNCSGGLLISGVNCVTSCPANTELVNSSYCKSIVDNSTNNSTNNTSTPTTTSSPKVVPIPFLIATVVWCLISIISRTQNPNTYLIGCLSSVTGLLCFWCWVVLLGVLLSDSTIPAIAQYLIIVAIAVQVVVNLVFMVLMETAYKDKKYQEWKERKCKNKTWAFLTSILSLFSFKIYLLQFSKLFNLEIFKACLESIKKFLPYNIMLTVSLLLCNTLALVSSGYSGYYSTTGTISQTLLSSVDCVVVTLLDIVFGIVSFKKPKEGFFEYRK